MTRISVALWGYAVAWLCSALLHTTDADVSGMRGLLAPSVLASVSLVGLIILVPILVCQLALYRRRRSGFGAAVLAGSCGMGLVLVLAGSTAGTTAAWLRSFCGSCALFGLVLVLGAGPVTWSAALRQRRVGEQVD